MKSLLGYHRDRIVVDTDLHEISVRKHHNGDDHTDRYAPALLIVECEWKVSRF